MTDEQLRKLLLEIVQQSHATHCTIVALVQLLIDKGVLKGDQEQLLCELENRSKDVQREAINEAWVQERARTLIEAWTKLPKQ